MQDGDDVLDNEETNSITDPTEVNVLVWMQSFQRTSKRNTNYTVQQLVPVIAHDVGIRNLHINTVVKIANVLGFDITADGIDSPAWYINLPEAAWGRVAHARKLERYQKVTTRKRLVAGTSNNAS